MQKIIKLAIIILALSFLGGCVSTKVVDKNVDLKTKMHGLWAEIYTDEGEILSYMYYIPEGKFHAFGYLEEDKNEFWFSFGNWEMKGNQSCIRFLFDTYGIMHPNEEMCVKIVAVTDDKLKYVDSDDGKTETLIRVSNGRL